MGAFNYECEGQISIFDYISKPIKTSDNKPKYMCLGKKCNHNVLVEVAKDIGYECKTDCCLKCSKRLCGARCNYSSRVSKNK